MSGYDDDNGDAEDRDFAYVTDEARLRRLEAENASLRSETAQLRGTLTEQQERDLTHSIHAAKTPQELDEILTKAGRLGADD